MIALPRKEHDEVVEVFWPDDGNSSADTIKSR
jgi:hypothetical protein